MVLSFSNGAYYVLLIGAFATRLRT